MNTLNFLTGIAIIIGGIFLLFAGPQLITIPSTETQVVNLFRGEAFTVGDLWERSAQLDEGLLANGTVAVSSALTGEPSDVSMLVLDEANYQKWVAHGSPTYVLQKEMANREAFRFTVPQTGVYHFVFDNTSSPVKKKVTMTVDLQRQIAITVPNERVRYVAYGLLGLGILVTAIGVLRKTQVPWA
jgi:hypothetical protein